MSQEKKENSNVFSESLLKIVLFLTTSYYKILNIFTQKDYFNRKHLEVTFEGMNLKIRWFSHDEYINHKLNILNDAKTKLETDEFVSFVLSECRHCVYVVFNCKNKDRFVQFWLGDGKLMADFPILDKNGMKRYKYAMLGVLNELDIHRVRKDAIKPKNIPYYMFKNYGTYTTYEVYFQQYPQEATQFVITMLRDVYKQNLDDLEFILE